MTGEGLAMLLHRDRWRAFAVGFAALAALLSALRSATAQESLVQPAGYSTPIMPSAAGGPAAMVRLATTAGYSTTIMPSAAGPTWDDFNALAQRLQATEARLAAVGGDY